MTPITQNKFNVNKTVNKVYKYNYAVGAVLTIFKKISNFPSIQKNSECTYLFFMCYIILL